MDPLDHLAGPAIDLLARVDAVLARVGAPDDHPVWPLLRRVRALPGDAAGAIFALSPSAIAAAARTLRDLRPAYDESRAALLAPVPWSGPAAAAYELHRTALVGALGTDGWGLAGRLEATASYLDGVAGWAAASRAALAGVLADVLGSIEAVAVAGAPPIEDPLADDGSPVSQLRTPPHGWPDDRVCAEPARATRPEAGLAPSGRAAAEIGARVLAVAADAVERAQELLGRGAPGLGGTASGRSSGLDSGPSTRMRLAY